MSETATSTFVGVGINAYDGPFDRLNHPVDEVVALADHFTTHDFRAVAITDQHAEVVRKRLATLAVDGCRELLLMWSGHGHITGSDRFVLPTADDAWVAVEDIVDFCMDSGADQLLIVVDACYAGAGINAALATARTAFRNKANAGQRRWVGVLVSCAPHEQARDGAFGATLSRLLTHGPSPEKRQLRWSVHNKKISGDDLGIALQEEFDGHDQAPEFDRSGRSEQWIPNPLWRPGAPARVVEHLLRAARGGTDELSWFTGRDEEVNTVVGWIRAEAPGIRVVTGSAGTGKSAIVGRVVSAADPTERANLGDPDQYDHLDPGVGSVHANVHARALDIDGVTERLDDQLIAAKVLRPGEYGPRNAAELEGALKRASTTTRSIVIAIDGLDEARGQSFTIARELVRRIAAYAMVIVSTRNLPGTDTTLIEELAPVEIVDLDAPASITSQQQAIHRYVRDRLTGVSTSMNPVAVAEQVVLAASSTTPFLLARILTDQLKVTPIDTRAIGWESALATSLPAAFELDLAHADYGRLGTGDQGIAPRLAAQVLTALTWALGSGFPESEWRAVAAAIAGTSPNSAEIRVVLNELGRYIIEDGEDDVAVYRLAHQSLADHIRPPFTPHDNDAFDPDADPIAQALLSRYADLLNDGHAPDSVGYLRRYIARHVASAGTQALQGLRQLAASTQGLHQDVALADLQSAKAHAARGQHIEALAPTEEAVALYRDLAADNPAYLPDLAGALNDLGIRLSEVGRRTEALAPTNEAVALRRHQASNNPAYLPELAAALNNLGIGLSEVGKRTDALAPTEEAVTINLDLANNNPAYIPDLARALNNLGIRLSEVGRRTEALAPLNDAVTLYRELAANNPSCIPDLAGALNNLGVMLSEVGKRTEAFAPTNEAITLYRDLAANNPTYLPDLARMLNSLGIRLSWVGKHTDALATAEEAVALYHDLAANNPAHIPGLANALNSLGIRLSEVGRRADSLDPTEEAVALYSDLATNNPAYRPDLARALNNLGNSLSEVGKRTDALAATNDAVTLYRHLASNNPAYRPNLAGALNNLGVRLSEVGKRTDAIAPVQEAVTHYRDLASNNPAYRPNLALALSQLGVRLSEVGKRTDAIAPTEEAVALYSDLPTDNPAHVRNLAATLVNLKVLSVGDRDVDRAEEPRKSAIKLQSADDRATRLLARARALAAGDCRAASWLVAATDATTNQHVTAAIRDCARTHRGGNPQEWDAAWSAACGSIAAWLTCDPTQIDTARAWIATGSYREECDYLIAHPELLDPSFDTAVNEALLTVETDADRYRALRAIAAELDITAAYEHLLNP
ncbi:tetratricopeptide repeat protein [Nocardia salmonicida]|uniref:tetratricopeptide repeat protein n=1 Tax=Nocardia salmonicida TaxID=53431 RepID=UPI003420C2A6